MNYKVIITGGTGMVGEGVLLECLAEPQISAVLSVSRRPAGITHPKLKEYLVPDFGTEGG
jgi:nucleoside-diphosphate-sugar epimerase